MTQLHCIQRRGQEQTHSRPAEHRIKALLYASLCLCLFNCQELDGPPHAPQGESRSASHEEGALLSEQLSSSALEDLNRGAELHRRLPASTAFIGVRLQGPSVAHAPQLSVALYAAGVLIFEGDWTPIWREAHLSLGRIDLKSASREPLSVKLKLISGQLRFAELTRSSTPHPNALPASLNELVLSQKSLSSLQVIKRGLAPYAFVTSRREWGAREPDQLCNETGDPYRVSIHHTASPRDDGGDPALRMREMQAYHMDIRGWCDLGYHFVVAQSGALFEGRRDERRPAAHVGGENAGNIGISLIGNFEEQEVGALQFNALIRILSWVVDTYDIPLDRGVIRGHREWPEQSTACPGQTLLSRLDELLTAVSVYEEEETGGVPLDPEGEGGGDALLGGVEEGGDQSTQGGETGGGLEGAGSESDVGGVEQRGGESSVESRDAGSAESRPTAGEEMFDEPFTPTEPSEAQGDINSTGGSSSGGAFGDRSRPMGSASNQSGVDTGCTQPTFTSSALSQSLISSLVRSPLLWLSLFFLMRRWRRLDDFAISTSDET